MLGASLLETALEGIEVWATYLKPTLQPSPESDRLVQLDIRDEDAVHSVMKTVQPDVVIHTASIGNVDYCETHKEESWQVNVEGTRFILDACEQSSCRLIYTSTNAVFDGEHAPYAEDAQPNPIHFYGKTKLESERLITARSVEATIIRPILMYGWNNANQRSNFVTWLLNKLPENQPIRLFHEVYCNPLPFSQCNEAIWTCLQKNYTGCFHIAGGNRVSMYEFGCEVAHVFGFSTDQLSPAGLDDLPGLVKRPKDTTYCTDKMETVIGIKPLSLREGLNSMKKEIE